MLVVVRQWLPAVAALVAHKNNLKTLLMEPTQILVQQHFLKRLKNALAI